MMVKKTKLKHCFNQINDNGDHLMMIWAIHKNHNDDHHHEHSNFIWIYEKKNYVPCLYIDDMAIKMFFFFHLIDHKVHE